MQRITWWPGDYLRDTGDLSLVEHGAYRVLLDHYYATDGRLKADQVSLFRICRAMTDEEQAAVGKVVRMFFTVDGEGNLHNKKADEIIAENTAYIAAAKAAGAKGSAKRWGKGKGIGNPIANPIGDPMRTPIAASTTNKALKEGGQKPARPDLEFIFADGLDALLAQGLSEREARSLLGRLVKEFGEADTARALTASIGKADVRSYALAILTKKKRDAAETKRLVI
jgi:uncharacterized protein YdaU (DUF1376 family)